MFFNHLLHVVVSCGPSEDGSVDNDKRVRYSGKGFHRPADRQPRKLASIGSSRSMNFIMLLYASLSFYVIQLYRLFEQLFENCVK